nr:T9SS type A sorting domain-containing protein [Bacteroidota bacterium]
QWSRSGGSDSFVKSINLSVDHEGNCYMAGVGGGDMTFGNITHYQEGFVYPILVKLENVLSVGINNNSESENTVSIFPNPANNYFTYSSSSGHNNPTKVTIFNQYGKQIHTGSYGPMQQISTSGYASGIYFIEFTMQDGYKVIEKLTAN